VLCGVTCALIQLPAGYRSRLRYSDRYLIGQHSECRRQRRTRHQRHRPAAAAAPVASDLRFAPSVVVQRF
jgi:hypothetical protein